MVATGFHLQRKNEVVMYRYASIDPGVNASKTLRAINGTYTCEEQ